MFIENKSNKNIENITLLTINWYRIKLIDLATAEKLVKKKKNKRDILSFKLFLMVYCDK